MPIVIGPDHAGAIPHNEGAALPITIGRYWQDRALRLFPAHLPNAHARDRFGL